MKCLNLVGPQVRKLRYMRGWSQNILAAKLQILGWDLDRVAVAKIESRLVHVDDYELLYFTKVFNVSLADLFPKLDPARRIHEVLSEVMQRRPVSGASPKKVGALGTTPRGQGRWVG
jgi:transcriptional regulator with XRE-family HTH domain